MKHNFWSGVGVTVVGGMIVSLLVYMFADLNEAKPKLSWFQVDTFTLPKGYGQPHVTDEDKAASSHDLAEQISARDVTTIAISNRGNVAASDVQLIVSRRPRNLRYEGPTDITISQNSMGYTVITLELVPAKQQELITLMGISSFEVRSLIADGVVVPRAYATVIVPSDGGTLISLDTLVLSVVSAILLMFIVFLLIFARGIDEYEKKQLRKRLKELGVDIPLDESKEQ